MAIRSINGNVRSRIRCRGRDRLRNRRKNVGVADAVIADVVSVYVVVRVDATCAAPDAVVFATDQHSQYSQWM